MGKDKEVKNRLRTSSTFISNHNKDGISKKYETLEDYNADQKPENPQGNGDAEKKKEG